MKYIVGIDEVGRGPLAGPVTVGVVACEEKMYKKLCRDKALPPLGKDSKKLTQKSREECALKLKTLFTMSGIVNEKISKQKPLTRVTLVSVVHVSNRVIDMKGISWAIRQAMSKALNKIEVDPAECRVLLDGGLHAPEEFKNQKTIIKGDEKEKVIAWASILAKVSRDQLMVKAAKKFPKYGFDSHKGYGTKKHTDSILKNGLSSLHRKSFCKKLV